MHNLRCHLKERSTSVKMRVPLMVLQTSWLGELLPPGLVSPSPSWLPPSLWSVAPPWASPGWQSLWRWPEWGYGWRSDPAACSVAPVIAPRTLRTATKLTWKQPGVDDSWVGPSETGCRTITDFFKRTSSLFRYMWELGQSILNVKYSSAKQWG